MAEKSFIPASLKSRWNRFSANFLSIAYSQAVTIAVQFAAVPFFLTQWGSTQYAEWLIITGLPTIIALLNPGVSQASAARAGMFAANAKIKSTQRSIQTALAFAIFISISLISISAVTGYLISWKDQFRITSLSQNGAAIVFILTTCHLSIQILGSSLDAWFRAIDRTAMGYFLLANRRMIDVLVTIAFLSINQQQIALATALVIAQALFLLLIVVIGIAKSPQKYIGVRQASRRELKIIAKPSFAHMGMTTAQAFTLQGGIQWLHQASSPEMVVAYSMGRTLMRLTIQLGIVSSNALRPELSRLSALGRLKEVNSMTRIVTLVCITLALGCYLSLIYIGPYIIDIWSSNNVSLNSHQLAMIGLHAFLNVSWLVPASKAIALNQHSNISKAYILFSAASVITFSIPASVLNPLYTAAVALAIPEVTLTIFIWMQLSRKRTN